MKPAKTLQATWFAMLALQTIGTVDTKRRLPAPRQFVAIGVAWGILFLVADMGYEKLAARFSLLMLLLASVLGPFGLRFVSFLSSIAARFGTTSPTATGTGTGSTSSPSQGTSVLDNPVPVAPSVNV